MGKTNTLIFLSIALKQTKAGPRSSGTAFPVEYNSTLLRSVCYTILNTVLT